MDNLPLISIQKLPIAPVGTIEGAIVPVIFGKVRVKGTTIYAGSAIQTKDQNKITRYVAPTTTPLFIAAIWQAICMGRVTLIDVYANKRQLVLGIDYDLDHFSDGTGTFIPLLTGVQGAMYAVGDNLGNPGIVYFTMDSKTKDPSLVTWTYDNPATSNVVNCVIFALNAIIIGGYQFIKISTAGVWSNNLISNFERVNGFCYGGGLLIAACDSGIILKSVDALTWVRVRNTDSWDLNSVVHSGSRYVAVGDNGGSQAVCCWSNDGTTWNTVAIPISVKKFYSVCYGNGIFVAVGDKGYTGYSADGKVWTLSQMPLPYKVYDLRGVAYNGLVFIAVGQGGTILRSYNGIAWTALPSVSNELISVCWDGIRFWCGANGGVYYSADMYGNGNDTGGKWKHNASPTPPTLYNIQGIHAVVQTAQFAYATKLKGIAHLYFNPIETTSDGIDKRVVYDTGGTTPEIEYVVSTPENIYGLFKSDGKYVGLNPAIALLQCLVNTQWGLGLTSDQVDIDSFYDAAESFSDSGQIAINRIYGINVILDQITSAQSVIDKIREMTDVYCNVENGKITCKNMYDYEKTASVLTLTDDDFKSCEIKIQSWDDVYNEFEGEYIEPLLDYAKRSIYVKNESAIEMCGGVSKKKKIDLSYFIDQDIASVRLSEIMQRESQPLLTVSCASDHKLSQISVGQCVTIASTEYGINQSFRVVQKSTGELNDLTINIDLQPRYEDLYDENYTSVMASLGILPIFNGNEVHEKLTFTKGSYVSSAKSSQFTDRTFSKSQVRWVESISVSVNPTLLTLNTHYTVVTVGGYPGGTDYIQLTSAFKNMVAQNSTGFLSIEVWEKP